MTLFWFDTKAGTALFQYLYLVVVCFATFSRFPPFWAKITRYVTCYVLKRIQ